MADLPTYPLTPEGVSEALNALDKGGSEDVAQRLTELGITGQRGVECGCPIASYLGRVLPYVEHVAIGSDSAYICGTAYVDLGGFQQPYDVTLHANLPDSVSAFVDDFDQGIYPELIESTEEVNTDA